MNDISEAIKKAEELSNSEKFKESNNVLCGVMKAFFDETEGVVSEDILATMEIIFARNYLGMAKELLKGTGRISGASDEIKCIAGKIFIEHFGPVIKKSGTGSL